MTTVENIEKWIGEFLSSPNEISLSDLDQGNFIYPWCEEVSEWLEYGKKTNWEAPIILPLKLPGEKTTWFASALDSKTATQLSVELLAHIGPSYSDFDGSPWGKDNQDHQTNLFLNNLDNLGTL